MPVYYFDLCARGRLEADEDGLEPASAEEAYLEACAAIPPLAAELPSAGDHPRRYNFVVTNEVGQVLFEIPFREILDR